jgi:hypothetical protein
MPGHYPDVPPVVNDPGHVAYHADHTADTVAHKATLHPKKIDDLQNVDLSAGVPTAPQIVLTYNPTTHTWSMAGVTGTAVIDGANGNQYKLISTNGVPSLQLIGPVGTPPTSPTNVVATTTGQPAGTASISFTPGTVGSSATTGYTATAAPGGFSADAGSSPIIVPNLSPGSYTFTVVAHSAAGNSPASAASVSITILAAPVGSTQLLAYDFTGTDGGVFDPAKVIESTAYTHAAPDGSALLGGRGKIITNARPSYTVNDWSAWRANLAASADQEALIDIDITSSDMSAFLALRSDADANASCYIFELVTTGLILSKKVAYAATQLATVTTVVPTYSPSSNTTIRLRVRAVGGRIQGRLWPVTYPEPTTWNIDYTDPTPIASGYVTFGVESGAVAKTDGSVFALFDNFVVNAATGSGSVIPPPPPGGGGTVVGGTGGVSPRIFAGTAFWYQDVSGAPLAADSAACGSDAVRQMKKYYGNPSQTNVIINTTDYAAPVYTVAAGVALVNVGYNNTDGTSFDTSLQTQFTGVPIPTYAVPADGSDSEMVIYQPSSDTMWEFWLTVKTGSAYKARWGGRLQNCSTSSGIFLPPGTYGTTATGLPFMGGQITIAEMTAAAGGNIDAIGHCLGIAFPELMPGHCWPAQRDDGPGGPVLKEGRRLRIDPGLNVAALPVNNIVKAVARAGQRYGFVIWDKSGSVGMRAENPKAVTAQGGTDPYPALFGTSANWNILNQMPWTSLQALPEGYGQ